MLMMKSYPSCSRSYSDLSLSFCLEDGSLLSAPYDSKDFQVSPDKDEEITLVKSPDKKIANLNAREEKHIDRARKHELNYWKYEKKERTKKEYPILDSKPIFDRPKHKWTSSDYAREITFQTTGKHTFHAQENLEILREFLNNSVNDKNKILKKSTWRLGVGNFYSFEGRFSYDFQKKNNPTKEEFLKEFKRYLSW